MAIFSFRAGPSTIQYPVSLPSTTLPSLSTLSFTASAVALNDSLFNTIKNQLPVGSYNVCLALVGEDHTTGGWSVGQASPAVGVVTTTTANRAIQIQVPLANWPANYQTAAFVAVFIQAGVGPYQFCKAVPITTFDQANTFYTFVAMNPISVAAQFTLANLQSSGNPLNQLELGDRTPTGFSYYTFITTGPIVITYEAGSSVTFSPNFGADFTVTGARVISVQFSVLANDVKTIAQSAAGDYYQVIADGHTYTESEFGINTAQIIVRGNKPLLITPPVDPSTGVAETMLFTSLLLQNQQQVAMAWDKKNQTPVPFQFQPVPNDALFVNQSTMYTRAIK